VRRFQIIADALNRLASERPECQSEIQMARDIVFGKRPGIEEKYDALILKLDRTYSKLLDDRDAFQKIYDESPLHFTRVLFRAKVKATNKLLQDLIWMRARNSDLINIKPSTK
jgi:hypothetical protein